MKDKIKDGPDGFSVYYWHDLRQDRSDFLMRAAEGLTLRIVYDFGATEGLDCVKVSICVVDTDELKRISRGAKKASLIAVAVWVA